MLRVVRFCSLKNKTFRQVVTQTFENQSFSVSFLQGHHLQTLHHTIHLSCSSQKEDAGPARFIPTRKRETGQFSVEPLNSFERETGGKKNQNNISFQAKKSQSLEAHVSKDATCKNNEFIVSSEAHSILSSDEDAAVSQRKVPGKCIKRKKMSDYDNDAYTHDEATAVEYRRQILSAKRKVRERLQLRESQVVLKDVVLGVSPEEWERVSSGFMSSKGKSLKDSGLQNLSPYITAQEDGRLEESKKGVILAKDLAIKIISKRTLPKALLFEKLLLREVSVDDAEAAIDNLESCGLVDDAAFAKTFARNKFLSLTWGPIKIRQELKQRGIALQHIEIAINCTFNEESMHLDDEDTEMAPMGLNMDAWRKIKIDTKKQWNKGSPTNDDGRKRRLIGWLQRRGYAWPLIERLLVELKTK